MSKIPNSYKEIVESFKEIYSVHYEYSKFENAFVLTTKGISIDGFITTRFSSYKHLEVANKVALKVSYFIGIKG